MIYNNYNAVQNIYEEACLLQDCRKRVDRRQLKLYLIPQLYYLVNEMFFRLLFSTVFSNVYMIWLLYGSENRKPRKEF
ncbi:hypothetical protein TSAR_009394 [Trichomalopsis sarcophagae]|uniref:Uncharacterized protein n=1 Tax=Trichomalopsis sarcophagae TaxID=543379 RepID=A0A232ETD6_9HYME|nr:hypothetical protein TSAR_009394 [Trichomalopsis sarcophagae]